MPYKPTGEPNGRPPIFATPEEMDDAIRDYFASIELTGEPITFTGLCLYLGFCSKQTFYEYELKPGFGESAKRARLRVEQCYEKALLTARNPAGPIFALKNFGWTDEQVYTINDARNAVASAFPDELKEGFEQEDDQSNKPEFTPPLQLPQSA